MTIKLQTKEQIVKEIRIRLEAYKQEEREFSATAMNHIAQKRYNEGIDQIVEARSSELRAQALSTLLAYIAE